MNKVTLVLFIACVTSSYGDDDDFKVPLEEVCSFNKLEYRDLLPQDNSCNFCGDFGFYAPAANVPRGFEIVGNRIFISIPRRMYVPVTLAVFDINEIVDGKCPTLKSYPTVALNQFSMNKCGDYVNGLVSVQGFSADQCASDRKLWMVDMGALPGPKRIKAPALVIISTKTDTIVRRRELPSELYTDKYVLGFVNVVVNVLSEDCNNTYAYIVNSLEATLTIYSYKDDKFWQFFSTLFVENAYPHSLFEVTTLNGTVAQYQLDASIWDLSVDNCKGELLFGARSSIHLFSIPQSIVHNETAALVLPPEQYGIKYLGQYNPRGQVASFHLIPEYKTVFGIQEQNYAAFCWDYQKKLTPEAVELPAGGLQSVPFLVASKVDRSNNDLYLYLFSNNLAGIVFDNFYDIKNFRIFRINIKKVLYAYPECTSYKPVQQPLPYVVPVAHHVPTKCGCEYCQQQVLYHQFVPQPINYVPVQYPTQSLYSKEKPQPQTNSYNYHF